MAAAVDDTRRFYEEFLSYQFRLYLTKSPPNGDLIRLLRSNDELRDDIVRELLRREVPSALLVEAAELLQDSPVRDEVWKRIEREPPPADVLSRLVELRYGRAATLLLADPACPLATLTKIIIFRRAYAEEAAERILALAARTEHRTDELVVGLYKVMAHVPRFADAAWRQLCAIAPTKHDLEDVFMFIRPFRARVREELLRRHPDSAMLRTGLYDAVECGLDPAQIAEHILADERSTKGELLEVVMYDSTRARRAWRRYVALQPTCEEVMRTMQDIPVTRPLAWRSLAKQNLLNADTLFRLFWNIRDEKVRRVIWKRLRALPEAAHQLHTIVSDSAIGIEAARMLLAAEPHRTHLNKVVERVPSLREEIFAAVAGSAGSALDVELWMHETCDKLRDL